MGAGSGVEGGEGTELLKAVTHHPSPSPPWLNYHVQPSGDEITETLTRTPTQGGLKDSLHTHTHTHTDTQTDTQMYK